MKMRVFPFVTTGIVAVMVGFAISAHGASSTRSASRSTFESEEAQLRVLKVYSATDGDASFRAYALDWNGKEVVAVDDLVRADDYKVGDRAAVTITRHKRTSVITGERATISFRLRPARRR